MGAAGDRREQTRRGGLDRHGLRRKQANDGYSFVVGNIGPAAVNPLLSKVPYDMERDFVAVSLIATGPIFSSSTRASRPTPCAS